MSSNILEKKYETLYELISHMRDSGRRHNTYHHYTNIDSLMKILKNKSLLLLKVDTMNDKQELKKIWLPDVTWQSAFSISFTYGTRVNMALWGLYAIPGECGVRISIDQKELINIIDNNEGLKKLGGDGDILDVQDGFTIDLYEILYASNHNPQKKYGYKYMVRDKVFFSDRYIGNSDNENEDARDLVGTFKNEAWCYEQEVRIRVKFDNKSAFEKLFLDISSIDLSKITITFSQWVNQETNNNLRGYIEGLGHEYKDIKFNSIDFTELVTYRDKCDFCYYENFKSKSENNG